MLPENANQNEIKIAMKPMESEIRDPIINRLNKSLPYLSVPNKKISPLSVDFEVVFSERGF